MSWTVIVGRSAAREIGEAALWYARQRSALREEFLFELEKGLSKLSENPRLTSPRLHEPEVRSLQLQRFPYRLVYEVLENDHKIVIAAFLHAARDEQHWKSRFKQQGD